MSNQKETTEQASTLDVKKANAELAKKAISIHGKNYSEVKSRILFLAEEVKDYSIETDYTYFEDRQMWVVKATLRIGDNRYTGLAQEVESDKSSMVNATSALENAETSAVGRACAMAGIGVLDSIASVDEVNKAQNRGRFVSQHIDPKPATGLNNPNIIEYNGMKYRYQSGNGWEAFKDIKNDKWIKEGGLTDQLFGELMMEFKKGGSK